MQPENVCHSIGGRDFWIEAVGFRKLLACLCTLTGPFESHAQVIVGRGEVGLEPDGLPVLGDGGVVPALVVKGVTQVIVGPEEVGFEPDGLPVLGDSGVVLALVVKGVTQGVVSLGAVAGMLRVRIEAYRYC